jgi:hypothetical protein
MPVVLIWDVFPVHRGQEAKDLAKKLIIRLISISAGQSKEYQPLVRRIFGSMKQQVREQSSAFFILVCAAQPGRPEALECMISVWKLFQ